LEEEVVHDGRVPVDRQVQVQLAALLERIGSVEREHGGGEVRAGWLRTSDEEGMGKGMEDAWMRVREREGDIRNALGI
jgi:hypothetical protein